MLSIACIWSWIIQEISTQLTKKYFLWLSSNLAKLQLLTSVWSWFLDTFAILFCELSLTFSLRRINIVLLLLFLVSCLRVGVQQSNWVNKRHSSYCINGNLIVLLYLFIIIVIVIIILNLFLYSFTLH